MQKKASQKRRKIFPWIVAVLTLILVIINKTAFAGITVSENPAISCTLQHPVQAKVLSAADGAAPTASSLF